LVLCGKATRLDEHAALAAAAGLEDPSFFAVTHAATKRDGDHSDGHSSSGGAAAAAVAAAAAAAAAMALGAARDLPPGAVCGGEFLPSTTRDANAAARREDLRRDWAAARAGAPAAAPALGREYGVGLGSSGSSSSSHSSHSSHSSGSSSAADADAAAAQETAAAALETLWGYDGSGGDKGAGGDSTAPAPNGATESVAEDHGG
jgi:hypothetical protein